MADDREQLSPGAWAVLALASEGATHGFAIARTLEPGGEVGEVFALPRPLVYRALEGLLADGLLSVLRDESSPEGPPRRIIVATAAGRARVSTWLQEPVEHVRDARTELLLKLLFLARAGDDPRPLLTAQRRRFTDVVSALEAGDAGAADFVRAWRLASARAALGFVDDQLADAQRRTDTL